MAGWVVVCDDDLPSTLCPRVLPAYPGTSGSLYLRRRVSLDTGSQEIRPQGVSYIPGSLHTPGHGCERASCASSSRSNNPFTHVLASDPYPVTMWIGNSPYSREELQLLSLNNPLVTLSPVIIFPVVLPMAVIRPSPHRGGIREIPWLTGLAVISEPPTP
jgi:hypothetical protein